MTGNRPDGDLLAAAFNSRSSVMRFGALALGRDGRVLAAGWNGQPDKGGVELAAARELEALLREKALEKGLPPETVHLILGKGFRRSLHAEGRALLRYYMETEDADSLSAVARVRIGILFPNGKYFGVKKIADGQAQAWSTCRHCARLFETIGAKGEILTTDGWKRNDPRLSFANASDPQRLAPRSFWDREKEIVSAALREAGRKNPPPVIETDFMEWRRLEV